MGPCHPEDKGNPKLVPLSAGGNGDHGGERDDVHHTPQQVQQIDPETIDPQQEQQAAWATAEGYTPLADWSLQQQHVDVDGEGMSTWMVSLGPGGETTSGDDGEGVLFVNALSFGASRGDDDEEDDKSNFEESGRETSILDSATSSNSPFPSTSSSNFEDIAARALLVLDDEYHQSKVRETNRYEREDCGARNSNLSCSTATKDMEDDDDIKIIAAAFDQRKEEKRRFQQQGDFPVDWDGLSSPTSNVATLVRSLETKKKDEKPVDTDAVKRVVNELAVKNKNNPFHQKFAAWQQKQQQQDKKRDIVVPAHDLIPPSSRKAFVGSSVKAKKATANLTRSATLAEAIVRILLSRRRRNNQSLLLIDVVGVDHVECVSVERIQSTFRPIVRWLGTRTDLPYKQVQFRLVGRELSLDGSVGAGDPVDLLSTQSTSAVREATATCHSGLYHEFLEGSASGSSRCTTPDLLVAFNAGIWGYREWETTIRHLAQRKADVSSSLGMPPIPMVITAYTLEECQEDHEVIANVTRICSSDGNGNESCRAKVLWEPEENPFGSQIIRDTKSSNQQYRENAYWQAWLLGGDESDGHC